VHAITVPGANSIRLKEHGHILVFVVGVVRSGTSLLYALLNQHPGIALMYESDVFGLPPFLSRARENWWLSRAELWNKSLSRHFGDAWPEALPGVGDARALYRAYAAQKGAAVYGEKCPFYCTKLPRLARKFPDARFIILRRDLSEVYGSIRDAGKTNRWFARKGMFCRMIRQQNGLLSGCRKLEAKGIPLLYVDYSSLVDDTEKTMREVCQFLDLGFEPKMASLLGADFSPIDNVPHHSHLRSLEIRHREKAEIDAPRLRNRVGRFQARANRLSAGGRVASESCPEPSFAERTLFHVAGVYFSTLDQIVRWIYEAAPAPLLRQYRSLRGGFQTGATQ